MDNRIITHIVSAALGAFILYWFFWPEFETKTEVVEVETIDTTFASYKEKYRIDSLKMISLSDSIDFYKSKYRQKLKHKNIVILPESEFKDKPILAPLRRFSGKRSFLYGDVYFTSIVAGELIEIDITNDFKMPIIKHSIKRTESTLKTEKSRGLYLGASINTELIPSVGASYLDKSLMIDYSFTPKSKIHSIGVKKKLF